MGRNPIGNALWKPDATNTSRNPWHLLRCERAWPEFNIWIGTRVADRSPDPLCAKIPHFCGAFQQPPGSTPRLEIHVDEPARDIVSPSKAISTVVAPARRHSVDGGAPFGNTAARSRETSKCTPLSFGSLSQYVPVAPVAITTNCSSAPSVVSPEQQRGFKADRTTHG